MYTPLLLATLLAAAATASPLSSLSHGCTSAIVMTSCQYPGQSACSMDGTVIAKCTTNTAATLETRWAPQDSCYARQMKCGCVNGQASCVPIPRAQIDDELR